MEKNKSRFPHLDFKMLSLVMLICIVTADLAQARYHQQKRSHHKIHKFMDEFDARPENHFSDKESKEEAILKPSPKSEASNVEDDDRVHGDHQPDEKKPKKSEGDSCLNLYCRIGRECKMTDVGVASCVCAGVDYCEAQAHHGKEVCGSDGVLYPSHCEMHRIACIKKQHIRAEYGSTKCAQRSKNPDGGTRSKRPGHKRMMNDGDLISTPPSNEQATTKKECTAEEYRNFVDRLLQHHCHHTGLQKCANNSSDHKFVVNLMFSYFDHNSDQKLDLAELRSIEKRDKLDTALTTCHFVDMLQFDDQDHDALLSLGEFNVALGLPSVTLDDNLKLFKATAVAGTSLELKCDVSGTTDFLWKRNGNQLNDLSTNDIKLFEDGSLYIHKVELHHIGNYTCQDRMSDDVVQTHSVFVHTSPVVRVNPLTQSHTTGATATLHCHFDGVPRPSASWLVNNEPILDQQNHYLFLHRNRTLQIRELEVNDANAFKCRAVNLAGTSEDVATVSVETLNANGQQKQYEDSLSELFVAFHEQGYSVYEPSHCHFQHVVNGDFSRFELVPDYEKDLVMTLCKPNVTCTWGDAVNVRNKFIYVSQPLLNRVIVIEMRDRFNPIEVIMTDDIPVRLDYVEHLDQVWVLCRGQMESSYGIPSKTSVIIRQASAEIRHHPVHTQPVSNKFDLISDIFLPPNSALQEKFSHGYAVHGNGQPVYKLDLDTMKYTKRIDLTTFSCVPKSMAFVSFGGKIIVSCDEQVSVASSCVMIDYVTDRVLDCPDGFTGEYYVSPDSRHLVMVKEERTLVSIYKILDDGSFEHFIDEQTDMKMSDLTFFTSERGYDLFITSANKNSITYVDLDSGRVETIEGVGAPIDQNKWQWSSANRVIVSGGVFSDYLMTPSSDSLIVIDGHRRHMQCEWQDVFNANVVVWLEVTRL